MTQPLEDGSGSLQDAHLRAALRHAPDAGLSAPPALGAAILKQASAAVQPLPRGATRRAAGTRWRGLARSAWTAITRPPVAAALATVMIASTLTLLWRDGLMDEPFDRPSAGAGARAADAAAPAAPLTPPLADLALTEVAPLARSSLPAPTPGVAVAEPAATQRRANTALQTSPAPAADDSARNSKAAAAPSTDQGAAAEPAAAAVVAVPPGPAVPAPVPARAPPAAMPPPPSPAPADQAGLATREAAPAHRTLARSAEATAQDRPEERRGVAGQALAFLPSTTPLLLRDNLATLSVELQSEPQRWSAQRDGSTPQAIGDAVTGWLQALAREVDAAAARPEPAASAGPALLPARGSASTAEPSTSGPSLALARDGMTQHRFQLGEDRLTWVRSGGSSVLRLSPAALRRLAEALPAGAQTPVPATPR